MMTDILEPEDGMMRVGGPDLEAGTALAPLNDVVIDPLVGVASVALNLAVRYCTGSSVSDGVLYQQYKLEGRNLESLTPEYVVSVATYFEKHLLNGPERMRDVVKQSMLEVMADVMAGIESSDDG